MPLTTPCYTTAHYTTRHNTLGHNTTHVLLEAHCLSEQYMCPSLSISRYSCLKLTNRRCHHNNAIICLHCSNIGGLRPTTMTFESESKSFNSYPLLHISLLSFFLSFSSLSSVLFSSFCISVYSLGLFPSFSFVLHLHPKQYWYLEY